MEKVKEIDMILKISGNADNLKKTLGELEEQTDRLILKLENLASLNSRLNEDSLK